MISLQRSSSRGILWARQLLVPLICTCNFRWGPHQWHHVEKLSFLKQNIDLSPVANGSMQVSSFAWHLESFWLLSVLFFVILVNSSYHDMCMLSLWYIFWIKLDHFGNPSAWLNTKGKKPSLRPAMKWSVPQWIASNRVSFQFCHSFHLWRAVIATYISPTMELSPRGGCLQTPCDCANFIKFEVHYHFQLGILV